MTLEFVMSWTRVRYAGIKSDISATSLGTFRSHHWVATIPTTAEPERRFSRDQNTGYY